MSSEPVFRQVYALRKSGQLDAAERLAKDWLKTSPTDSYVRDALCWVLFDRLKALVSGPKKTQRRPGSADQAKICDLLRDYARTHPAIPSLSHSQILQQLNKIGRYLDCYAPFLKWCGSEVFRDEDFGSSEFEGKTIPPLAVGVSGEAMAWIEELPEKRATEVAWALGLAGEVYKRTEDVFVDYGRAKLCRILKKPEPALEFIRATLTKKGKEFWAWTEAGRILELCNNCELAIAAYCRACTMPCPPEFLNPTRVALAMLLGRAEQHDWAAEEVAIAKNVCDQQGWNYRPELEVLLARDWANVKKAEHFNVKAAYELWASRSDEMFVKDITMIDGSFIGTDQYDRPRYAVMRDGVCTSVIARFSGQPAMQPGAPVSLRAGSDDSGIRVLSAQSRSGHAWDCVPETAQSRTGNTDSIPATALGRFRGPLRMNSKGFGFVEDVFVHGSMLDGEYANGQVIEVIAGRRFENPKNRWSWTALALIDAPGLTGAATPAPSSPVG